DGISGRSVRVAPFLDSSSIRVNSASASLVWAVQFLMSASARATSALALFRSASNCVRSISNGTVLSFSTHVPLGERPAEEHAAGRGEALGGVVGAEPAGDLLGGGVVRRGGVPDGDGGGVGGGERGRRLPAPAGRGGEREKPGGQSAGRRAVRAGRHGGHSG